MAESHVVPALVSKRAEIAGLITRTEQQLGQFRADLGHLDATLRLFAPELEPKTIPAKRIRQADPWFEHGELPRRVLDALRRTREPIHAADVVRPVMIDKGFDPAGRQSFARVQWKVKDTLKSINKHGLLVPDSVGHGVRCKTIRKTKRAFPDRMFSLPCTTADCLVRSALFHYPTLTRLQKARFCPCLLSNSAQ
jgi:hypothetical protein